MGQIWDTIPQYCIYLSCMLSQMIWCKVCIPSYHFNRFPPSHFLPDRAGNTRRYEPARLDEDEAQWVKTTRFARRQGRAALTLCERAAIKPKETCSQRAAGLSAVSYFTEGHRLTRPSFPGGRISGRDEGGTGWHPAASCRWGKVAPLRHIRGGAAQRASCDAGWGMSENFLEPLLIATTIDNIPLRCHGALG